MKRANWVWAALLGASITIAGGAEPPAAQPVDQALRALLPPRAEEASAEPPRAARQRLDEALRAPAEVTFSPDQTVGQALQGVAERSGLAIGYADPALADVSIRSHYPHEVELRGLPLGTALAVGLEPMGLTLAERDGELIVARRADGERSAADRISAALGQETRFEFSGTTLREALQSVGASHGVNVIVDEKDLATTGVKLTDPVTAAVRGVSLDAALSLLLEPYGLTYVTAHDVLLVTTADRAAREIDTRSYDVTPLVGRDGYSTEASNVLTELLEPCSTLAAQLVTVQGGAVVPLPRPRIVPFQRKLLVTASWADQRRVAEILRLMELGAVRAPEGRTPFSRGTRRGQE